jgi:hypothetical protein
MTKEPKTIKRFNNGHKTHNYQEQEFLKEIYNSESSSFEKFTEKMPTMRRPRNPVFGEDTPRAGPNAVPTTELWIPASHFPPPFNPTFSGRDRVMMPEEATTDISSTLYKRKTKIESELRLVQKQLAYKKTIMNGSA